MKAIALIFLWTLFECNPREPVSNGIANTNHDKATKLAPLPLRLPAMSLANNGAQDLPVGPHIEAFTDKHPAPFLAPAGVTNIAFGKKVSASVAQPVRGNLSMITDGNKEAFNYDLVEITNGVQWVQVDLEHESSIYAIAVWHNHYRRAVSRGVIVQVADNAAFTANVRTLFNNDYENLAGLGLGTEKQYFEDHRGKLIDAKGVKARYLRLYGNGSSSSSLNGYAEVEAWGFQVTDK